METMKLFIYKAYNKCRHLRKKIQSKYWTLRTKLSCGSYGKGLSVNFESYIGKNVHLGKNVNFNGIEISSGGQVNIGDNFHSGKDCRIICQIHNFDSGEKIPYDSSYITKDVIIEDNVWLGHNVIILGGVTIGEGAILQAGSVVVKSIPPLGIAGGNPAKVFKERDSNHYFKLKKAGQFH
jgi:acetyltransferase-like isoleucine patch superfamily enzyme